MKISVKSFIKIYVIKKIITIIILFIIIMSSKPKASEIITQDTVIGNLEKTNVYNNYSKFFNMVDDSFIIPGLKTHMCPQGMCGTEKYILISAYDLTKKNNSCIYVIDKNSGKYLKTVWIDYNKTHVGGITYDNKYVYIANSSDSTISRVKLDIIITTNNNGHIRCKIFHIKNKKGKNIRASFCSYDKKHNVIWIGTFNPSFNSYAYGFSINNDNAELKHIIKIPSFSQGMCFDDEYIYISSSLSIYLNSKIYKCKYKGNKLNIVDSFIAPPSSENVFIDNGKIYILFESAAYQYHRGSILPSFNPLDRVCIYNL